MRTDRRQKFITTRGGGFYICIDYPVYICGGEVADWPRRTAVKNLSSLPFFWTVRMCGLAGRNQCLGKYITYILGAVDGVTTQKINIRKLHRREKHRCAVTCMSHPQCAIGRLHWRNFYQNLICKEKLSNWNFCHHFGFIYEGEKLSNANMDKLQSLTVAMREFLCEQNINKE